MLKEKAITKKGKNGDDQDDEIEGKDNTTREKKDDERGQGDSKTRRE